MSDYSHIESLKNKEFLILQELSNDKISQNKKKELEKNQGNSSH